MGVHVSGFEKIKKQCLLMCLLSNVSFFLFTKQGKSIKYPGNYQIHRDGLSPPSGWNTLSVTGKLQYISSAFSQQTCHFSNYFALWSKYLATSAGQALNGSKKE